VVFDVVATLRAGEPLYILGRNEAGTWVLVRAATGREGWIAVAHSTGQEGSEAVRLLEGPLDISHIPLAPYIPPTPKASSGGVVTTEHFLVYFCRFVGDGTWEWYEVEVTYVDGQPVREDIAEGPFTGSWQAGCPPPSTEGPSDTPAPPPPTEGPTNTPAPTT
jgi:hypothetical protein